MSANDKWTLSIPLAEAVTIAQSHGGVPNFKPDFFDKAVRSQFGHLRPRPKVDVGACAVTVCFEDEPEVIDLVDRVERAWFAGKRREAALALRLLASATTDECRTIAESMVVTTDYAGAEAYLRGPASADASVWHPLLLGTAVLMQGRAAEALPLFQRALPSPPTDYIQDILAGTGLAVAHLRLGNPAQCASHLKTVRDQVTGEKWKRDDKLQMVSGLNLARVYRVLGDTVGAAAQYGQVLAGMSPERDGAAHADVLREHDDSLYITPDLFPIVSPAWGILFLMDVTGMVRPTASGGSHVPA